MKRLSVLAAAAALAGCGSMAPTYERPAAPVAAAFPDAGNITGTAAAELPWQQFFSDARLQQLITLALQNNRDLRVAALNIEQARATITVRNADVLPSVGVGIGGTRQALPGGAATVAYSAGAIVSSWELDFFGRLRSLTDVAAAQLAGSEEAKKAVQIGLVAGVASAWFALQADDELLRVTRATLASRDDSRRLTQLRFDNGAASQLDVRQAESLLETARVTLYAATRQRAQDRNALELLLGQPLPAEFSAELPALGADLPDLPAGLPSDVLVRRPDVRQAEQQLMAANANIGAARAAFFPRISLTASAGSVSGELSGLFKGGSFGWSLAPQLLQPIFDAGRNQANLKIAQLQRDAAVAQYEKAVQSAFRDVADALAGRATLGEQRRAQAAQVSAEEDRARLADLRYRNGAASYLDVLDAQRSLFAAQQALVQVRAAYLQNGVALYRVLGGGWQEEAAR